MICPNCDRRMQEYLFDHQTLLHCDGCGGSYFAQNGINRISLATAKVLQKDLKSADQVTTTQPEPAKQIHPHFCPRDHGVMLPLYNDETVPHDVELLECHDCHGGR